jgi:hypothetical protein
MAFRDSIVRVEGRLANVDRRLELPKDSRCFGLKRGKETKRFAVVMEFTTNWKIRYSGFRQQLELSYGTLDDSFTDLAAQMSYWAYGVGTDIGVGVLSFDVYGVDPQRRDVVPPTSDSPMWRFYLTRLPEERFTLQP